MYERRVTPVIILDEIHHGVTSGVPRLVNSLATNCLLYACEKKQRQVDEETVYQAQSELNF